MANKNYNDQVFINCPFDDQYLELYRASIFVILDAGFIPRCSKEVDNATQSRLSMIMKIIKDCCYGMHDLSRVEFDVQSGLPRFNMPFEFSIFYSARHFGNTQQQKKHCLVLEKEQYRYQKFISDIAGIDVTAHQNSPKELILAVRKWLVTSSRRATIPPGENINSRFENFQSDIRKLCLKHAHDYDSMPFIELVANMTGWLRYNQEVRNPLFGQIAGSDAEISPQYLGSVQTLSESYQI